MGESARRLWRSRGARRPRRSEARGRSPKGRARRSAGGCRHPRGRCSRSRSARARTSPAAARPSFRPRAESARTEVCESKPRCNSNCPGLGSKARAPARGALWVCSQSSSSSASSNPHSRSSAAGSGRRPRPGSARGPRCRRLGCWPPRPPASSPWQSPPDRCETPHRRAASRSWPSAVMSTRHRSGSPVAHVHANRSGAARPAQRAPNPAAAPAPPAPRRARAGCRRRRSRRRPDVGRWLPSGCGSRSEKHQTQ
mmetsp:Transcript_71934/g.206548  ORF Transcript_71934/g.206548 Transcript_71934/m.206548 type:complete len:255 (-) Transcript_71934:204-968(-)